MLTGRGVCVAVVDSGVNATHPHVGGVAGGIAIDEHGVERADYLDRLGHGTAVTAAIRLGSLRMMIVPGSPQPFAGMWSSGR